MTTKTVNYQGAKYSSSKMSHIAAMIAQKTGELPSEVYLKLVGRKMTDAQDDDDFVSHVDSQIRYARALQNGFPSWHAGE
jgi:hypothetical protein